MATARTRNEWLYQSDENDSEGSGYDSEALEESRTQRAAKRRKLAVSPDHENSSQSNKGPREENNEKDIIPIPSFKESEIRTSSNLKRTHGSQRKKSSKPTPQVNLKTKSKTGVVYLSRIPPFMKPQAVKSFLSPYGEIGRVFLTPEDSSTHSRRVKFGGNKKRSFIDGWVEFIHKRDAKLVADSLNAQTIGGKKGSWYHDDVWNIKYLKGFKWHHLTEQIANENAERAARLRADIAQSTKENKRFIDNVEKAKMLEGIQAKKGTKREKMVTDGGEEDKIQNNKGSALRGSEAEKGFARDFKQHRMKEDSVGSPEKKVEADTVRRVLSKML